MAAHKGRGGIGAIMRIFFLVLAEALAATAATAGVLLNLAEVAVTWALKLRQHARAR